MDAGKRMKLKKMEKRTPVLERHQGSEFDPFPGISKNKSNNKTHDMCLFFTL